MTAQKSLKRRIRARMRETGESYSTARRIVLRDLRTPEPGTVQQCQERDSLGVQCVKLEGHGGGHTVDLAARMRIVAADLKPCVLAQYHDLDGSIPCPYCGTRARVPGPPSPPVPPPKKVA